MDEIKISAKYLYGIDLMLQLAAPDLQHHIRKIGGKAPLEDIGVARGQSIFSQLPIDMRVEDAKAILESLRSQQINPESLYGNYTGDANIACWESVVIRLEEKQKGGG